MTLKDFFGMVVSTLDVVIIFLVALSVATFFWGVVRRLAAGGDPRKIRDSYFYLMLGVVTFSVISSLWLITIFLASLLGIKINAIPQFRERPPITVPVDASCDHYTDPKDRQDCELGIITTGIPNQQDYQQNSNPI